jgi:hypothetical protein
MIFKIIKNPNGSINMFKSKLEAKGFHQQATFYFKETLPSITQPATIRVISTLVVTNKWFIQQNDMNNAFLIGHLRKDVYMMQPL